MGHGIINVERLDLRLPPSPRQRGRGPRLELALLVRASIVRCSADTSNAVTGNDILVVFRAPPGSFSLSDELELDLTRLDVEQDVVNLMTGKTLRLKIASPDVHDLRLPSAHSTSRFPSLARRMGA